MDKNSLTLGECLVYDQVRDSVVDKIGTMKALDFTYLNHSANGNGSISILTTSLGR